MNGVVLMDDIIIKFLKLIRINKKVKIETLKSLIFKSVDNSVLFDDMVEWGLRNNMIITDEVFLYPSDTLEAFYESGELGEKIKKLLEDDKIPSSNSDIPIFYFSEEFKNDPWNNLKVEKFLVYPGSNMFYEIVINDEKIKLEDEDILSNQMFRKEFFNRFGFLLPPLKTITWSELITKWRQERGEVKYDKREELTEDNLAVEEIINFINGAHIVSEIKYTFRGGYIYNNGTRILIPTDTIRELIQQSGVKISLRRLSYLLKDYLLSGTIPYKVGTSTKRFWIFDKSKFDINESRVMEFEKDDN